jgi:hypothetical protein
MAQRYMFINFSAAPVTIHVFSHDDIQLCELVDSTPVQNPEQCGSRHGPGDFDLMIPPGAIVGFLTDHTAAVKAPQAADFVMHVANGNVPWPEPPPQEQNVRKGIVDFNARYRCFLALAA